jgi:hypothetical protein
VFKLDLETKKRLQQKVQCTAISRELKDKPEPESGNKIKQKN